MLYGHAGGAGNQAEEEVEPVVPQATAGGPEQGGIGPPWKLTKELAVWEPVVVRVCVVVVLEQSKHRRIRVLVHTLVTDRVYLQINRCPLMTFIT